MLENEKIPFNNPDDPLYVYFEYKGIKVSELLIPSINKNLSQLITENSNKYNIPVQVFLEMLNKNKIDLSDNAQKSIDIPDSSLHNTQKQEFNRTINSLQKIQKFKNNNCFTNQSDLNLKNKINPLLINDLISSNKNSSDSNRDLFYISSKQNLRPKNKDNINQLNILNKVNSSNIINTSNIQNKNNSLNIINTSSSNIPKKNKDFNNIQDFNNCQSNTNRNLIENHESPEKNKDFIKSLTKKIETYNVSELSPNRNINFHMANTPNRYNNKCYVSLKDKINNHNKTNNINSTKNSKNHKSIFNSNYIFNKEQENEKFFSENILDKSSFFMKNSVNFDSSKNLTNNFKSLTKVPNQIKNKTKSHSTQSNNISYGERLYFKSFALEEKNKKKLEQIKKQKQDLLEKSCTFKPKLNQKSILMNLKSNYSKLGNLDNNISGSNFINSKFSENKNIRDTNNNNNQNISYNNITGNNSNLGLFQSKSFKSSKSRIRTDEEIDVLSKRLFNNAEKYRNKKIKLSENFYTETCPFTPDIIRREDGEIPNIENFFNRLQVWVDKRNNKYETDVEKSQFDERTGKRLFSPQINRLKKYNNVNICFN